MQLLVACCSAAALRFAAGQPVPEASETGPAPASAQLMGATEGDLALAYSPGLEGEWCSATGPKRASRCSRPVPRPDGRWVDRFGPPLTNVCMSMNTLDHHASAGVSWQVEQLLAHGHRHRKWIASGAMANLIHQQGKFAGATPASRPAQALGQWDRHRQIQPVQPSQTRPLRRRNNRSAVVQMSLVVCNGIRPAADGSVAADPSPSVVERQRQLPQSASRTRPSSTG